MKTLEGFMHGVNLGGWLSQCVHTKEHYDSFITEKDVEELASWGIDHLRVPIDYELVETEEGEPIEAGYQYIESCIDWCRKYGLNMILDLHKTAGYVFDNQEASEDFFEQPKLMERFTNLWVTLAERFVKDKDMLVFELLNELVDPNIAQDWNRLAARTIDAIRKVDCDVKIIYGGIGYNSISAIKLLEKPQYDNIIFTFHCYEPVIFTHQGAYWTKGMPADYRTSYPRLFKEYVDDTKTYLDPLMEENYGDLVGMQGDCSKEFFMEYFKEAVDIANSYQVPLYCGEYGVIDLADAESTLNWYKDITSAFDEYGIGRAVWSYKKMDFGLMDDHYEPVRKELISLL